jgi:AraC-like DNA-binding protein
MATSTVLILTESEQYEQSVRGVDVREFITGPGNYRSRLTKIALDHLWIQRSYKTVAGVSHTAVAEGRAPIAFPVDNDQQPTLNNGRPLCPGEIVCYAPGTEHHLRTAANYHVCGISLTPEALTDYALALAGRELNAPAATRVVRPSSAPMLRLMRLHKAACDLATDAPDLLAHPAVARAMEQELVRAMLACLTEGDEFATVQERERTIMRRFEQALEAHEGEVLHLSELCAEIGVSDRSLGLHCQERLGMSPHHYLWLRRMNMARRALARADSARKHGHCGRSRTWFRRAGTVLCW